MAVKTLQQVFDESGYNLFSVGVIGTAAATALAATNAAPAEKQRLISNICVPIYPVVIDDATFKDLMRDAVLAKCDELEELSYALTPEYTDVTERVYGQSKRTDVRGARSGSTTYAKRTTDNTADAYTDHTNTEQTFDRYSAQDRNIVEPEGRVTNEHAQQHTKIEDAAHTDQTSEDAATDTSTTDEHTDYDRHVLTPYELAELKSKTDAQIYSVLRQIIVEAVAAARKAVMYHGI